MVRLHPTLKYFLASISTWKAKDVTHNGLKITKILSKFDESFKVNVIVASEAVATRD